MRQVILLIRAGDSVNLNTLLYEKIKNTKIHQGTIYKQKRL